MSMTTVRERAEMAIRQAAAKSGKSIDMFMQLNGLNRHLVYTKKDAGLNVKNLVKICEVTGCDANWLIGVKQ